MHGDIGALYREWVGRHVFLPGLQVYAMVFDITSRGEVGIRFSSVRPDDVWEVRANILVLGVDVVLAVDSDMDDHAVGLDMDDPPVRAYPPVECPWTERLSWGR